MQTTRLNVAILVGALFGIVCSVTPARAAEPDRKAVESVKGVPVRVAFALGSYAAFRQVGSEVMGDLVLLEVTAVHNHLNEMSPHVMYMHYERRGEAVQLAKASRQALSVSATPLGGPAMPPATNAPTMDTKQVEQELGRRSRGTSSSSTGSQSRCPDAASARSRRDCDPQ